MQLSQLNLQFTFMGPRALGENIEDKSGAVEHTTLQLSFNIALLAGGEVVVKNNQLGATAFYGVTDLF